MLEFTRVFGVLPHALASVATITRRQFFVGVHGQSRCYSLAIRLRRNYPSDPDAPKSDNSLRIDRMIK